MAKLTVKDVELKGKKVLVRVDFNVPVKDGVITNDNRITAALPTIKYILEQGGRAILFSHLGRVKEEADKAGKSLAPVAADLAAKLGQDVAFLPGVTRGAELEAAINALEDGQVLLVENTRYEDVDGKKESKNDPELGKYWASLGDGIFETSVFNQENLSIFKSVNSCFQFSTTCNTWDKIELLDPILQPSQQLQEQVIYLLYLHSS